MRRSDWIMLWTLSLLWGGSFLFVELALAGLTPLSLVWGRVALAAAILWAVLRVTGAPGPPRSVWPALLVMGFLNNAVPFTLFALAQGQITGVLASVLNAMTPLFTVLVAHLATADERLTPLKALGVALGFALGFARVLVMILGESLTGAVPAMLACLCAAVSYAAASVWGRRFRRAGVTPLATMRAGDGKHLSDYVGLGLARPTMADGSARGRAGAGGGGVGVLVDGAGLSSLFPHSGLGVGHCDLAGNISDPSECGRSGLADPG